VSSRTFVAILYPVNKASQ